MRPNFTPSEIQEFINRLTGSKLTHVKPLGGYIDQNFRVTTSGSESFLIKVHSSDEKSWVIDFQNATLEYLEKLPLDFKVPQIKEIAGQTKTTITKDGNDFCLRCLTYLEGELLYQHNPVAVDILQSAGTVIGQLDKALESFEHPASTRPDMEWDLRKAPAIRQYASLIKRPDLRRWSEHFFLQYEIFTQAKLLQCPVQVTHHDGHRMSILVDGSSTQLNVTGLIDFGDILRAPRICNLAVSVSDLIVGQDDLLKAASTIVQAYHSTNPLTAEELELIYNLVGLRLAIYASYAARSKQTDPNNPHAQIKLEGVRQTLRQLIMINPVLWTNELLVNCGFPSLIESNEQQRNKLIQNRRHNFSPSLYTHYKNPLVLHSSAFQYLYDMNGKTYLDCVNNVSQWGHCHPQIIRAAVEQSSKLNTNSRYVYEGMIKYANELLATFPKELDTVFFVNSGSEANDLAARMAKAYTGNSDFVVIDRAYHGNSTLATDLSPNRIDRENGPGLPEHVWKIECPDTYRGKYRAPDKDVLKKYVQDAEEVLANIHNSSRSPAAFFAESLIGTGGQIVFPDGYLSEIYKRIRAAGGVCIADEVQVGFGRTGHQMWCYESQNVTPDIVTMGKPIGNGHPMAAVVTRREIAQAFDNGISYFNTFGGNPVSCAVGIAVLDVLKSEDLLSNTMKMSELLFAGLKALQSEYSCIGDIRGLGLYIGVEIVSDYKQRIPDAVLALKIVEGMKELGVLLNTNGYDNNIIKIKPPLIIDSRDVEEFFKKFRSVLVTQ